MILHTKITYSQLENKLQDNKSANLLGVSLNSKQNAEILYDCVDIIYYTSGY